MYLGTAASPGIAMGKVLVVKTSPLEVAKRNIQSVESEIQRFHGAIAKAKQGLEIVRTSAFSDLGADKAEIFDAHILLLEDPELIEQTEQKITDNEVNAEFAYNESVSRFVTILEGMNNEYMRERAADIRDVSSRVLKALLNIDYVDLANIPENTILVAHDLTPSDTAVMNKKSVKGFITDIGGRTSHTAIIARTLEIPAVVGLKDLSEKVSNHDFVILNGYTGEVFVNPTSEMIREQQLVQSKQLELKNSLNIYRGRP